MINKEFMSILILPCLHHICVLLQCFLWQGAYFNFMDRLQGLQHVILSGGGGGGVAAVWSLEASEIY